MTRQRSDALVFFGATGDLARKQIFPALLALLRRGQIDLPIIGVGGVRDATTARELLDAGATAVQVGTATFANPRSAAKVLQGLQEQGSGT